MDELARRLDMDPVELRIRNAMSEGSVMPTGQVVDSAAPVAELLRRVSAAPLPPPEPSGPADPSLPVPLARLFPAPLARLPPGSPTCANCPAGCPTQPMEKALSAESATASASRTSVSPKASTTTRRPGSGSRWWLASPPSPCTPRPPRSARAWSPSRPRSPGRNWGWSSVVIHPADTTVGSAGSSSASRQTYVTGGAVRAACAAVRDVLFGRVARRYGVPPADLTLAGGKVGSRERRDTGRPGIPARG